MKSWKTLWHDERGFVVSAELVLMATIACIGLIVGLISYRDAIMQELADTGAAVNALNQSYSFAILENTTAGITVSSGVVTITSNFGDVDGLTTTTNDPLITVVTTFRNFSYEDQTDVGDDTQAPGAAPAGITFSTQIEEGQALP
jgi:hypothetical protein